MSKRPIYVIETEEAPAGVSACRLYRRDTPPERMSVELRAVGISGPILARRVAKVLDLLAGVPTDALTREQVRETLADVVRAEAA